MDESAKINEIYERLRYFTRLKETAGENDHTDFLVRLYVTDVEWLLDRLRK